MKDDILDAEELAVRLMELLWARYPQALEDRVCFGGAAENLGATPFWEAAGRKRGLPAGLRRD